MKVHHLNLCTMCPIGMRFMDGELVVHALVVETPKDGLVLVDAGMGLDDVRSPKRRLGTGFVLGVRPELREEDTAARQIERLGFSRKDVRHVVVTHLDVDHAGGIPDFPEAAIHVYATEHAAAMRPASLNERMRYRKPHFSGSPRWELHEAGGDRWNGFESVRAVADDVLMIPVHGHTRGHCAIAVRAPAGDAAEWLLHCGDAYFHADEMKDPPRCPPGLAIFQKTMAVDDARRVENQARLRTLHREAGKRIRFFSAHSPVELRQALSASIVASSRPGGSPSVTGSTT
ncbi:MAG: MBL fold metallo-hydrolase [Deltaproteobacteria bacterium]|nr:MBL fold metallo-hydrolase [Deltaproteobacteria bacterium]